MVSPFQDDIDAIGRIDAVPTILDVICRMTGMGFAAVARVTEDHWVTCRSLDHLEFGLKAGDELAIATTMCSEVRAANAPIVVDNVAENPLYCGHPVPALYGFQSYISVPIILADGSFFGTLCAIDPKPARLENTETLGMFTLFAELIAAQLAADARFQAINASLLDERRIAELREQFIAVLGHDLRNPVAAIDSGMQMLLKQPLNERSGVIVNLVQGSTHRMRGLIDNIMDFARGRLGSGLPVELRPHQIAPLVDQVVRELRAVHPQARITVKVALDQPIRCDDGRVAQMLSNLLANAITHGDPDSEIEVEAHRDGPDFCLSVANAGDPIPARAQVDLFKPFVRGANQQGLGLGLFISHEIAKAHGGALEVISDQEGTKITFRLPIS